VTAQWKRHPVIPGEIDLRIGAGLPRARVWTGYQSGEVFWCVFAREGYALDPKKNLAPNEAEAQRAASARALELLEEEAAQALAALGSLRELAGVSRVSPCGCEWCGCRKAATDGQ